MLAESLRQIVGAANVLTDERARRYASADIFVWPDAVLADLVVRPGSTAETAQAVDALKGKSIVPRGAGLSYTGGVVPHGPAVVVDTARLDAIDIHADDLYAVVGAGCTWESWRQRSSRTACRRCRGARFPAATRRSAASHRRTCPAAWMASSA